MRADFKSQLRSSWLGLYPGSGTCLWNDPSSRNFSSPTMREPAHPDVFPEHLRSFLLPVPENSYEALFLFGLFLKRSRKTRKSGSHDLQDRIESVEGSFLRK